MNDPTPKSLDQLLAELSPEVAPPGRLWHAIVFGIARRQYGTRRLALAASLACAILAAGVIWAVLHGSPESRARLPLVAARATVFDEPTDAKYVATRASLESTFRERLALLDPATRAHIERSLAEIRQAHEDIRKALAGAPADPLLQQMFASTWHDEIDLYDQVVRATQPTAAKT
jgi:hypothetical protein